jgi:hypothetical protein
MTAARSRIVVALRLAAAQEPVASFDLLSKRLHVGDSVWVTDARDREIKGRIAAVDPSALTLYGVQGGLTISAGDVRLVRQRTRDSLLNGTLIGFGVGFATGLVVGHAVDEGGNDAWNYLTAGLMMGSIGAGLGALADALTPGRTRDVYRAPAAGAAARLSLAPILTPRTKGVRLSFSF